MICALSQVTQIDSLKGVYGLFWSRRGKHCCCRLSRRWTHWVKQVFIRRVIIRSWICEV